MDYAGEMKLQQPLVYSLAIIVWVNNFQAPKIQAVLSNFFPDCNDIVCGSIRGGGWGMGLVLEYKMDTVWGLTGPFLCSQYSKLKITDISRPFVACPALQLPIQESHDYLIAPKFNSRLTQGLRKAVWK